MKTTLITLLTAILLVLAALASGRHFDATDFIAIGFTTGLVGWTATQYGKTPRTLTRARCIHLPINAGVTSSCRPASQQAA